jgi:hypothetical protein
MRIGRRADLQGTDRLLAGNGEPPLGAHRVTPRRGYLHHGIYVGKFKVVHYSGLAHGLLGGPVEEVPLARFVSRQCVWVRPGTPSDFNVDEVISRARSRVGEDRYRMLTNNCEHFCEWCLRGRPRSLQVEACLAWPRQTLLSTLRLLQRAIGALQPPLSGEGKAESHALISDLHGSVVQKSS